MNECFVGEMPKARLSVFVWTGACTLALTNDETGLAQLVEASIETQPGLVVLERLVDLLQTPSLAPNRRSCPIRW